ncbi:hypothetical protein J2Z37_001152 [Ammoniphilus resinae]|uniref:Uncharacterized protein n=1 Tax=Ammoniphilus resinae TaxID=861532 RepID=A0ABS4GLL3_9BACL|nr:hypothetical protein [Ammoniphilus resinae]
MGLMKDNPSNRVDSLQELEAIGTHASAATNLHQTRTIKRTAVQPPVIKNPGPYDTRTGNYE